MNPLKTRILSLIAVFEGSRGGAINAWDEQYLSLGTLHYAVRMGPGARFLIRIRALDPVNYRAILGAPFDDATRAGAAALTEFCRVNVWGKRAAWQRQFTALSRLPAYQQADAEAAAPYFAGAQRIAQRYALESERGLTFAMDRCVQQGSAARPAVDRTYRALPTPRPAEYDVMKQLARTYADTANPKYRAVVLARSLTVALGDTAPSGYPGTFNLARDFGIRPDVSWNDQV